MSIEMDSDRTHAIYIAFDEERMIADKQDIDTIKQYIDGICTQHNMHLSADGWYVNGTFETAGAIILVLSIQEWFINYVKEWYLYDDYDGSCEDLVYFEKTGEARYVDFAPKQYKE